MYRYVDTTDSATFNNSATESTRQSYYRETDVFRKSSYHIMQTTFD